MLRVKFLVIGKTKFPFLREGEETYQKRLKHYLHLDFEVLSDVKVGSHAQPELLKQKEGEQFLKKIEPNDWLVLLDERGTSFSSKEWAKELETRMMNAQRLVFVVGGAFGFSDEMYARSNAEMSLSKLTFNHQMIRLFFLEQLYRAMTIVRNEPYHNE